MKLKQSNTPTYYFPSSPSAAIALQKELVKQLILTGNLNNVDLIAGADVSSKGRTGRLVGAMVVWSLSRREILAQATAVADASFPYIPGLLSFRELPALLQAFDQLTVTPDVVICDGQGIAHPRGIGIASHLGLLIGIPTVGCGKSRLVGDFVEPGQHKGDWSSLFYHNAEIGKVVRTRDNTKPLFISPGHLCSIDASVNLILNCCDRYRLPEPIRAAHNLAGEVFRSNIM